MPFLTGLIFYIQSSSDKRRRTTVKIYLISNISIIMITGVA